MNAPDMNNLMNLNEHCKSKMADISEQLDNSMHTLPENKASEVQKVDCEKKPIFGQALNNGTPNHQIPGPSQLNLCADILTDIKPVVDQDLGKSKPPKAKKDKALKTPTKPEKKVKEQIPEKMEVKTRRAKKQAVTEEAKDEKYWEMRRKNNEATKRCREAKKLQVEDILTGNASLEKNLEKMKLKVEALEEKYKQQLKTNKSLRHALSKMSKICKGHLDVRGKKN